MANPVKSTNGNARRKIASTTTLKRLLQLRLYVAGSAPNSVLAIANAKAICERHYPSRYALEIVDLLEHPERALADGIIVTPTLLKLSPAPAQRVIGNLGDAEQVVLALAETRTTRTTTG